MKMLMCRAVTRLMSKRLDAPLSLQETMRLKLHLSMCSACKQCNAQFQLMHDAGKVLENQVVAPSSEQSDQPL